MTHQQSGMNVRLALLAVAVVPLAMLAVATQLEPSAAGLGTHQQLGLPPCSFRRDAWNSLPWLRDDNLMGLLRPRGLAGQYVR